MQTLYEAFEYRVSKRADAIAIIDDKAKTQTTFHNLQQQVDTFSKQLYQLNVQQNDRVLILEGMSHKLYVALIALFKVGATAVFVDPSQSASFVNEACRIAEPKAIICSKKALLLKLKFSALRKIRTTIVTSSCLFYDTMQFHTPKSHTKVQEHSTVTTDTPALMTFTSGSTGTPKAIVRSHEFLLTQYHVLQPHIKLREAQVDLTGLPIFLLANLFAGISSIIANVTLQHPKKINPDVLIDTINTHNIERIGASPALFEQLQKSEKTVQHHPNDFYMGGAAVMPSLLHKLQKKFPHTELHVLYGSSEAEPISSYTFKDVTDDILKKMYSGSGLFVGKVVDEIELDFLEGEIIVAGEHVVKSYYKNQGDKENKLRIHNTIWHKTGDMGYLDSDNNLWLLGRKSALIKKGDQLLHPFSIEVAMREQSDAMAALVEHNGSVILLTESKNSTFSFEGVDEVRYIKEIPLDKRHNAKVDYVALKQLL